MPFGGFVDYLAHLVEYLQIGVWENVTPKWAFRGYIFPNPILGVNSRFQAKCTEF